MKIKSLDFKILILVLLTCLAVGVISGLWFGAMEEKQLMSEYNKLLKLTSSRYTTQIQEMFISKTKTGVRANRIILQTLTDPQAPCNAVTLKKGKDGAFRFNDELAGAFLSNRSALTPDITRSTGALQWIWPYVYPFVEVDFSSFYVILGGSFMYITPAEWTATVEAEHDYHKDIFYYPAEPANNPERNPVWTKVYYDSIMKKWMTSLLVPLYINNRFAGLTGSDYVLDDLFRTITEMDSVEGWCRAFIFNGQGSLIAHPDFMDDILENQKAMNAVLSYEDIKNPDIRAFIGRILKDKDLEGQVLTFEYRGKEQHACVRTLTPSPNDWRLVVYTDGAAATNRLEAMKKQGPVLDDYCRHFTWPGYALRLSPAGAQSSGRAGRGRRADWPGKMGYTSSS